MGAVAGPEIERLVQLLARLPGLGPRSARRAALHLIKKREALMMPLSSALQVALEPNAQRSLVNELSRKLDLWTGRRWTIVVSNEKGQATLREQSLVEKNERERAAEADPRVQEVLARFPGARIIEVRKLAPEPPDSDISAEVPVEEFDGDDDLDL